MYTKAANAKVPAGKLVGGKKKQATGGDAEGDNYEQM
jgi:hypothetical protein